jgi:hypothetical protein
MGQHQDLPSREDEGAHDKPEADQERKRRFERAIPVVLKRVLERALESGASRLAEGPENLRHLLQDLKLPKDVLHYLYTQVDDTKNGLYRVVAKEIRDVLENTQFAEELTKVLTKLSFEIKTEIRFIPNDAMVKPPEAGDVGETQVKLPKPEVVATVAVKERGTSTRRERRGPEDT